MKHIVVSDKTHKLLKLISVNNDKSIGEFIDVLLEFYIKESNIYIDYNYFNKKDKNNG